MKNLFAQEEEKDICTSEVVEEEKKNETSEEVAKEENKDETTMMAQIEE